METASIAEIEWYYDSTLHQADFVQHSNETREKIITWVKEQAEDRIVHVVLADAIDRTTKLVLANAIYYYGTWQRAFGPERSDFFNASPSGLVLNKVLHKAFIGVDEHATEAGAATVEIASPGAEPPLMVPIDRMFVFAIRDTKTGTRLIPDPGW